MKTVKNIFSKLLPSRGNSLEGNDFPEEEEKEGKKVMNPNKFFYPSKVACSDWSKYGFCLNELICRKDHSDCSEFSKSKKCSKGDSCESFHRKNDSLVPKSTLTMLSKECASCKLKNLNVFLNCGHSPFCEGCSNSIIQSMNQEKQCPICKSQILFFIYISFFFHIILKIFSNIL